MNDQFCPRCDISLDLHGTDNPDEWDCEHAKRKADLLAEMERAFGLRR